MKFLIAILGVALLGISFFMGCEGKDYPIGRDTYHSFGEGRYQLLRVSGERLDLFDLKTGAQLLGRVNDYKRQGEFVYLVGLMNGTTTYCIVDFSNEEVWTAGDVASFPHDSRDFLRQLTVPQ